MNNAKEMAEKFGEPYEETQSKKSVQILKPGLAPVTPPLSTSSH